MESFHSFSLYGCGNLPLQGTKLLVIMAISRSLGESIIRQPTMPAALHPNPMHMSAEIYASVPLFDGLPELK
jgi:hypothetical protein